MKVVIDARKFGPKWAGIGRYVEELVRQLEQIDRDNQYVVLLSRADFDSWQPSKPNFSKELADFRHYGLAEQTLLPLLLYRLRPDVVHFQHFTVPLAYFGRYTVTVHDFILVRYKNIRGGGLKKLVYELKYWAMRLVIRHAIMVSRTIIVPTQFVKDDILAKYGSDPLRRIRAAKITVTHEAVDPIKAAPESIDRLQVDGDFLLYVGAAYAYKNLQRLVEAFAEVAKTTPALTLILAGKEDYFYRQLKEYGAQFNLGGHLIFAGFVSEGELRTLYQKAKIFVFPSLDEGFGLPPLEAMAQGAPVISSYASCMPEVCGEAAAYFDPLDARDMANKIGELLKNKSELERLHLAGPERVKQFSWRKMAEQTQAVYRQVESRKSKA